MARRGSAAPPVATITLAADTVAEQALLEVLQPMAEQLVDRRAVASTTLLPARLIIEVTLTGGLDDAHEALQDAQNAVQEVQQALNDLLGAHHGCTVMALTVQTGRARQEAQEAAQRDRNLMGVKEISLWRSQQLGREVTPQSIQRTIQRPTFPPAYVEVAAGKFFRAGDVEEFFHREDLRVRPQGVAEPATSNPGLGHRQALAALLLEAERRGDDLSDTLVDLGRRPHQLTGQALAQAITALGGSAAVADRLSVSPRTVQRWLKGATDLDAAGTTPAGIPQ